MVSPENVPTPPNRPNRNSLRHKHVWLSPGRIVFGAVIVALVGIGFMGGIGYAHLRSAQGTDAIVTQIVNRDQPGNGISAAVDFSLFWQVWDKLHERYVDPETLDAQALVYGAIAGMVDAVGDPYTVFFEPKPAQEFLESVSGSFSGVGMEIGERDGLITVISPLKDSPAMQAGVRAGDHVLAVDGDSTQDWSVEEAVSRIRGKRGTTVTLTLSRAGSEPFTVAIVRDTIRIPAVEWKMLDDHIAYVQIYSFNANAAAEFQEAADGLLGEGATRIILDLRNNPGGLLDAAVDIAGWMVPRDSVVLTERDQDGVTAELRARGNSKLSQIPTVILMNSGSASASEILAGALHDIRNLRLVGEQSFGKGSVQQLEEFFNGSSLKVTIAKWFTPKGTSISDTGIAPTDMLVLDPDDSAADDWVLGEPGTDPQLDRALEIIRVLR